MSALIEAHVTSQGCLSNSIIKGGDITCNENQIIPYYYESFLFVKPKRRKDRVKISTFVTAKEIGRHTCQCLALLEFTFFRNSGPPKTY